MKKAGEFLESLLESLVIAAVIVFLLMRYIIFPVEVVGSSMQPNLMNGQRGFSFKITRKMGIERFDIVVIDSDSADDLIVKRVIGMPNETIQYTDSKLYIDGVYVEEDFLDEDVITNDFYMVLGEDEYCCLGDNRSVSRDSRYYGAFKDEELITTHIFIFQPFDSLGYQK